MHKPRPLHPQARNLLSAGVAPNLKWRRKGGNSSQCYPFTHLAQSRAFRFLIPIYLSTIKPLCITTQPHLSIPSNSPNTQLLHPTHLPLSTMRAPSHLIPPLSLSPLLLLIFLSSATPPTSSYEIATLVTYNDATCSTPNSTLNAAALSSCQRIYHSTLSLKVTGEECLG